MGPCWWGRRLLLMICNRGWHVLFIHELVWSRSAAGKSWFMWALCTPDAYGTSPRCRAVRPICLEMGLHTSSSAWLCLFPSPSSQLLHTHMQIGWSRSYFSCSRGHLGDASHPLSELEVNLQDGCGSKRLIMLLHVGHQLFLSIILRCFIQNIQFISTI